MEPGFHKPGNLMGKRTVLIEREELQWSRAFISPETQVRAFLAKQLGRASMEPGFHKPGNPRNILPLCAFKPLRFNGAGLS